MKPQTKDLMKEALVRWNQTSQAVRAKVDEKLDLGIVKKSLIHLYLASPAKVQYALAKFGVRMVVKKKKAELQEFIRH